LRDREKERAVSVVRFTTKARWGIDETMFLEEKAR
jgi:hypothetical protein